MVICWWTLFHCCPCLLVVLVVHGQLLLPGCLLIVGSDKRGSVTGCERLLLAVPTWLLRPVTRRNFSCNLQRNSTLVRCKIGKYMFHHSLLIYF